MEYRWDNRYYEIHLFCETLGRGLDFTMRVSGVTPEMYGLLFPDEDINMNDFAPPDNRREKVVYKKNLDDEYNVIDCNHSATLARFIEVAGHCRTDFLQIYTKRVLFEAFLAAPYVPSDGR